MTYQRPTSKWPWRDFLTAEEEATLAAADAAKREWQRLNIERTAITNRALQRAKYALARGVVEPEGEPARLSDTGII